MTTEEKELLNLAEECEKESRQLFAENRLSEGVEVCKKAADLYLKLGVDGGYLTCMNMTAIMYEGLGYSDLATDLYLDCISYATEHDSKDRVATFYNNIGSQYKNYNSLDKATECFMKAKEYIGLESEYMQRLLGIVLNLNLCEIALNTGKIEEAQARLAEAAENCRAIENPEERKDYELSLLSLECRVRWEIGDKDFVNQHIDGMIDEMLVSDNTVDYQENMEDICRVLFAMKSYDRLQRMLDHCQELCNDDNFSFGLAVIEKWIRYYKEIGDTENYLKKCEEYHEVSVKKIDVENALKADDVTMKVQLRETNKQRASEADNFMTDSLAGVGNRYRMLQDSTAIIAESVAERSKIGVGLIDIDYFKECNDTYGHIAGDNCIREVAGIVKEAVGSVGNVYRFGGDEFLILVTHATKEILMDIAKEIQDKLYERNIPNAKSAISDRVTISQGYTMAIAEEGDNIDYLIDLADKVLYRSKRYGRNNYNYMRLSELVGAEEE